MRSLGQVDDPQRPFAIRELNDDPLRVGVDDFGGVTNRYLYLGDLLITEADKDHGVLTHAHACLLYTSDAADE